VAINMATRTGGRGIAACAVVSDRRRGGGLWRGRAAGVRPVAIPAL